MALVEITHRLPLAEGAQLMPEDFATLRRHHFELRRMGESRQISELARLAPKAGYITLLVENSGMHWHDAADAVGQPSSAEMRRDLLHLRDIGHLAAAHEALDRLTPRAPNTEKMILWHLGEAGTPVLVRKGLKIRGLKPLLTSGSISDWRRGALQITWLRNPHHSLLGVRNELQTLIQGAIRLKQRAISPVSPVPCPLRKTRGIIGHFLIKALG